MNARPRVEPRLVIISTLAVAILLGLVFATGGGLSSSSTAAPTDMPVAVVTATSAPSGQIRGVASVQARRLHGKTWHYVYTVRNTGTVPIAGFQINAPQSNLFHISGPAAWNFYGSGVCAGSQQGILIYWSTNAASPTIVQPKQSAKFAFDVNTTGSGPGSYSLSFGTAQPLFAKVAAPASSSLAASGPCTG